MRKTLPSIIRITHRASGEVIAEGKKGWQIMPFEGNFYIHPNSLKRNGFKTNFIPGICIYKFLYVWLDWQAEDNAQIEKNLGWRYIVPNPLLPFIWFRPAVSGYDQRLQIEIL